MHHHLNRVSLRIDGGQLSSNPLEMPLHLLGAIIDPVLRSEVRVQEISTSFSTDLFQFQRARWP